MSTGRLGSLDYRSGRKEHRWARIGVTESDCETPYFKDDDSRTLAAIDLIE